jgi:hypothetical protein
MQLTQPQKMEVPLICIQAHILSTTHSSTWLSRNCPKQRAHKTHAHSQRHHNIPYSLKRVTLRLIFTHQHINFPTYIYSIHLRLACIV